MLFHGVLDGSSVPFEGSELFCANMIAHGGDCRLEAYRDVGHRLLGYGRRDHADGVEKMLRAISGWSGESIPGDVEGSCSRGVSDAS